MSQGMIMNKSIILASFILIYGTLADMMNSISSSQHWHKHSAWQSDTDWGISMRGQRSAQKQNTVATFNDTYIIAYKYYIIMLYWWTGSFHAKSTNPCQMTILDFLHFWICWYMSLKNITCKIIALYLKWFRRYGPCNFRDFLETKSIDMMIFVF